MEKKFDIESQINKLNVFEIPIIETAPESLTYIQNLRKSKQKTEKQVAVFSKINEIVNELEEKGEVSDQYVQHVINRLYNNRTLTPNENKIYNEYKEDIDNEIKERKENPLEDISDDTIIDNNNILLFLKNVCSGW